MRDFILKVLSNKDKFLYESLTYSDLNRIQEHVMNSLNLNNLNQLRDKYEGVAFIEKFSSKIFGIIALEKKFKVQFIDWKKLNPKSYIPKIDILGKRIDIIMSDYGDFPVIDKLNKRSAIIVIKKDKKDVWICGFADVNVLNSNQSEKYLKGEMMKDIDSKTTFIGYNKLKPFKTLAELESLVLLTK